MEDLMKARETFIELLSEWEAAKNQLVGSDDLDKLREDKAVFVHRFDQAIGYAEPQGRDDEQRMIAVEVFADIRASLSADTGDVERICLDAWSKIEPAVRSAYASLGRPYGDTARGLLRWIEAQREESADVASAISPDEGVNAL